MGAPAALPACVVPLAYASGLLPRELLMEDVDTLADWLRSKARIHKTILPSTLRKLDGPPSAVELQRLLVAYSQTKVGPARQARGEPGGAGLAR